MDESLQKQLKFVVYNISKPFIHGVFHVLGKPLGGVRKTVIKYLLLHIVSSNKKYFTSNMLDLHTRH